MNRAAGAPRRRVRFPFAARDHTNREWQMNENDSQIRIAIVQGTVRPDSYTSRLVAVVREELDRHPGVVAEVVDPALLQLTLPGVSNPSDDPRRLRDLVAGAAGVVFVTPEYHGSYSAASKMIIENLGFPSRLAKKPVALLGCAAGQIGAIKALEHLRSVLSHVGAMVLPGSVSVARVREAVDEDGRIRDEGVEARVRGVASALMEYIRRHICPGMALETQVRTSS